MKLSPFIINPAPPATPRHPESLDTEVERRFADLTFLAARVCAAAVATISLVDEDRRWFKFLPSGDRKETPRDVDFCAQGILQAEVLVVRDARTDQRFAGKSVVADEDGIRFYAGAPLIASNGHVLGMLSVNDRAPRELSEDQREALQALGRIAVAQLESRPSVTELPPTLVPLITVEESLRLLGSAVEQAKESILITDAQLDLPGPKIVFVNPAFTAMTGYTAEEAIGKSPRILQGPHTDRTVLSRLRKNLERGEDFAGEAINYRKDGTAFDLDWQVAPIRNVGGEITHFVAIQRDITERKKMGQALQRQQTELRVLFDLMPAMVWFKDTENRILRVNQRAADVTGKAVGEIEGKSALEIFPTASSEIYKDDAAVIQAGVPKLGAVEAVPSPDGKMRFVQTDKVPVCDPGGTVVGLVVMVQDITDRHRIQQELKEAVVLRENEQRYSFLADSVPLILWTGRPDGGVDYYNKAWFDYTGLTLAQTTEWGWSAVLHPDDLQPCIQRWTHSFTTGADYEIEYRFKRAADGVYRWFLGRASARRNEAGAIVQWVGTCTDIDDQKRAKDELLRAHARLECRVADRTAELEKANAALQLQQTELRVLFDLMPAMIWFKDTENGIIRVNRRAAEAAGKPVKEIEGKPSVEIYPREAAAYFADDVAVIRSGEPKLGYVETLRDATGDTLWVQTDKVPYCDKDGKVVGIVVMSRDITASRRAESLVRQSEERYRSLVDHARDAIFTIAADETFTSLNPAVEVLSGHSRANWLGKSFAPMVDPADLPLAREMFTRVLKGEQVPVHELRSNPSMPRSVLMEMTLTAQRNEAGKIIGVLGVGRDITERKKTENALRESNEKFHQLANNITDAFWIRSPDMHEVHYISPAFTRIWGRSVESLYAEPHHWADFIFPADRDRVLDAFAELVGTVSTLDIEYRIVRPAGEVRWVHVRGFQVRDSTGKLIRHTGIVSDITERRQSEGELERVHRELVDFSRRAGMAEVATGVLHNVGNLLNSVNVSATVVAEHVRRSKAGKIALLAELIHQHKTDLNEFLTKDPRGQMIPGYLDTLTESLAVEQTTLLAELEHLRKNIDHIKDIVGMQQAYAGTSGVIETVALAELIEDALRTNAASLARHQVALLRDYQTRPEVVTDKHKVMQILINLVRNAKYACVESARTNKQITVRLTGDQQRIKIAVIDNGVGIPGENLTLIFNHGFTTRQGGHGFGLHSSSLAAKELGGSLHAQSAGLGHGAMFLLELPCQPDSPDHEHSTR